ncbi:hypothetical protein ES708_31806 [subsurface metagenome]
MPVFLDQPKYSRANKGYGTQSYKTDTSQCIFNIRRHAQRRGTIYNIGNTTLENKRDNSNEDTIPRNYPDTSRFVYKGAQEMIIGNHHIAGRN